MLGQANTPGSQLQSAFTTALASHNINATATVLSDTPEEGDSIQDQIYSLTTTPEADEHLGAIIGSSVGSGVALLLLATAFAVFGRGWLKNRRLKKQTAAYQEVMGCSTRLQQKPFLICYLLTALARLWGKSQPITRLLLLSLPVQHFSSLIAIAAAIYCCPVCQPDTPESPAAELISMLKDCRLS